MSETSSSSPSDVQDSVYVRCDAAYLRQLHEASGMDETQLARIACLSVAQVRQLLAGGDSLFYSQAVKRQAYKRLLLILGAPPPSQVQVPQPEASHAQDAPPSQTIDDIVALSERNQYLDHRPVVDFMRDMRLRVVQSRQTLAALAFLMLALMLLLLNWPAGESGSGLGQSVVSKEPPSKPQVQSLAPTPVIEKPVETVVALVDKVADKVTDKSADKAPEPEKPADKSPAAPTVASKACVYKSDKLPEITPGVASKEARYVYLVGSSTTEVCVVDGNRQATSVSLRAGEGRSVYGPPPWQLSGPELAKVQIFFQGWRVPVPDDALQGITLLEKPR